MASYTYTIGSPISPPTGGGTVAVTHISQTRVACDGGYRLDLVGTFPVGHRLNVYIGPTGTTLDAKCVSGKVDQGNVIYAVDASHLYCFTPRLPIGGPFSIMVRSLENQVEALLSGMLYTIRPDFRTSVFALRSMFPTVFLVGSRKIEDVPPIPNPT